MKFSQTRDNRFIVGVPPVTVQFDKISEQQSNKIQCIRALLVTRDLRALPGTHVGVKFASQFPDLFANAFEFGVGALVSGEVAQLLDIFFQALDFLLAFGFFRTVQRQSAGFVLSFGAHSGTVRTAGWPQISRMASSNSGEFFTRCCACSIAVEPSGGHNSNPTRPGPRPAGERSENTTP